MSVLDGMRTRAEHRKDGLWTSFATHCWRRGYWSRFLKSEKKSLPNFVFYPHLYTRRKRIFPTNSFSPPKTSLQLWTPLLLRLQSRHSDLPSTLINRIVSHLLPDRRLLDGNATIGTSRRDDSFDMCIARWAWWIVQSWNVVDDETDFNLKKDTIIMLITALGPETTANENAYVLCHSCLLDFSLV